MTFEELKAVNAKIKTTDIKGKAYAEVNSRILAFRKLFPMGMITTEIVSLEDGVCVIKATVRSEEGIVLGTGYAYEKENSTFINKTSYIENAETSAVGRALGMVGIGIDTSIASYEETANAIANQKPAPKAQPVVQEQPAEDYRTELRNFIRNNNLDAQAIAKKCGLNKESTQNDYLMALIYAKTLAGGEG